MTSHLVKSLADGPEPVVLRVDSVTGEAWILSLEPDGVVAWNQVRDNLESIYTYNPDTEELELGVRTPDGRDLSELSNEELIRLLYETTLPDGSDAAH